MCSLIHTIYLWGPSWLWSYGSWINNYLCNQCLSPLKLWVRISLRRGVLDTTLCDKAWQWLTLATGRWFSPVNPVSSSIKTDCLDIAEILVKVALNTIILTICLCGYSCNIAHWTSINFLLSSGEWECGGIILSTDH